MPKWTPERRAAFEAEKAAKRGGVATMDDDEVMRPDGTPVEQDGAEMLSAAEMFIARMHAKPAVATVDELENEGDVLEDGAGSNVEHKSAGLVWMYKRETWGWRRLKVTRNGLDDLVKAGFRDRCGNCGSTKCPGTINGCAKGKMRMFRDCPVAGCNDGRGKRFYDMEDPGLPMRDSGSPFEIHDEAYAKSTPESRTKTMLDDHIRSFHEQEARARGLFNIQSSPLAVPA